MCDYEGKHFGANYIDTCCIDGYLWDLDSCEEPGGPLYSGGEMPCPKCNTEKFLLEVKEDLESGAEPDFTCDEKWKSTVSLIRRICENADEQLRDILPTNAFYFNGEDRLITELE